MTRDNSPSAAQRLLELAAGLGVDFIFTNLGSDHPAFIEAMARLTAKGVPMPRVIVCPHEMTALSAAHGHAMITRRPQLVLVHVDVGGATVLARVTRAALQALALRVGMQIWVLVKAVSIRGHAFLAPK